MLFLVDPSECFDVIYIFFIVLRVFLLCISSRPDCRSVIFPASSNTISANGVNIIQQPATGFIRWSNVTVATSVFLYCRPISLWRPGLSLWFIRYPDTCSCNRPSFIWSSIYRRYGPWGYFLLLPSSSVVFPTLKQLGTFLIAWCSQNEGSSFQSLIMPQSCQCQR